MDKKIIDTLQDLYVIEPQLRQFEPQLSEIITKLLASKPATKFDAAFAKALRKRLLAQSSAAAPVHPPQSQLLSYFNRMHKFGYALGGAAFLLLLAVPVLFQNFSASRSTSLSLGLGPSITTLGSQAFGNLAVSQSGEGRTDNGVAAGSAEAVQSDFDLSTKRPAPAGLGGGGGRDATAMVIDPRIMPPYPFYAYKYVYTGGPTTLTEKQMEVYRRDSSALRNVALNQVLTKLNVGMIDLSSFQQSTLQNLSFTTGDDWMGSIDFTSGTISVNSNREIPVDGGNLQAEQVPDGATLIAAANDFLRQHGISTDGYGQPVVRDEWRVYYLATEDKSTYYIPDVSTVVYPTIIDGVITYDQSGYPDGLMVNVSNRDRRVQGAWNIAVQRYQASRYDVTTDVDALLQRINSNNQPVVEPGTEVTTVAIELGTPELVLVKLWHWDGKASQELFSPAYRFPVMNKPQDQLYFQDALVIPIATQLLENQYGVGGGPVLMMKGQGAGGGSGVIEPTVVDAPEPTVAPLPAAELY